MLLTMKTKDVARRAAILPQAALNERGGRTIVMVLHDLNQAARYADEVVAIRAGRVVASAPPDRVITAETVREVFGAEVEIIADPSTGGPLCIPAMGGTRAAGG